MSIQINIKLSNSCYREFWNYKNADFELLNNRIKVFNWDTLINNTRTADKACIIYTNRFIDFCNECISRRKVSIRQNDKPWLNSELRCNIRLRDRLRKGYCKTKTEVDRLPYKCQRNKVHNMKKYAKATFIDKIDDLLLNQESGNSTKPFWEVMGRSMGKRNKHYNTAN